MSSLNFNRACFENVVPYYSGMQLAALTGMVVYTNFNPNYLLSLGFGATGAMTSSGLAITAFVNVLNVNANPSNDLEAGVLREVFTSRKDVANLALNVMSTAMSVYQFYAGVEDAIINDKLKKESVQTFT